MAGHGGRSGSRSQRSEVGDQRSSRILKFSIRKLSNPQFAILFAHIRSSLSVLDLLQHLLLEALADEVDQNFLTDPFGQMCEIIVVVGDRLVSWDLEAGGTAQIGLYRPATNEWFLDLPEIANAMILASTAAVGFLMPRRHLLTLGVWWLNLSNVFKSTHFRYNFLAELRSLTFVQNFRRDPLYQLSNPTLWKCILQLTKCSDVVTNNKRRHRPH